VIRSPLLNRRQHKAQHSYAVFHHHSQGLYHWVDRREIIGLTYGNQYPFGVQFTSQFQYHYWAERLARQPIHSLTELRSLLSTRMSQHNRPGIVVFCRS